MLFLFPLLRILRSKVYCHLTFVFLTRNLRAMEPEVDLGAGNLIKSDLTRQNTSYNSGFCRSISIRLRHVSKPKNLGGYAVMRRAGAAGGAF